MVAWRPDEIGVAMVATTGHVGRPWPHALALVRDPRRDRWPGGSASGPARASLDAGSGDAARCPGGVLAVHAASLAPAAASVSLGAPLDSVARRAGGLAAAERLPLARSRRHPGLGDARHCLAGGHTSPTRVMA